MAEEFALKDYVTRASIRRLGEQIQAANPSFPLDSFVQQSAKGLSKLEFTARNRQIAAALKVALPDEIPIALDWIVRSLPEPMTLTEGMFKENFWLWPLSDFIHEYGQNHWKESLNACYHLTQCFTSEFAVRPHLHSEPERTLKQLNKWSKDKSFHVRRFCSESPRPRLPWASRLNLDRDLVYPILFNLRKDEVKFVQKSVANHLNDLGKDDPAWLIKTMSAWSKEDHPATNWIIKHALRNLIKEGDQKALAIIGFGPAKTSKVALNLDRKSLKIGDKFEAQISFTGLMPNQKLLIDWAIFYYRKNGEQNRKVFKGKEIVLAKGEAFSWTKSFAMKQANTRALYPGPHRIEAQINGKTVAGVDFQLKG